ncbi:MAG: aminotransferase class I/II-fold pyridoxal phosphate-dependent enzyme [Bacillota bacterium]|nr:aminotransferase class I/II-fold pyridoxal phosphate-dependent enzyme [Bacillota bacterium]MDW7684714.1 aminotransferase class I/II-fold pyridoxal phosphate-dependent enzyme [Bacillota bacterium]
MAGKSRFVWKINNTMDQTRLPIWEKAKKYNCGTRAWLHVPGHGGGPGLPPETASLLAGSARFDLTELPGLDDLFCPQGAIKDAQALAACVWHSDACYFLVNGSSAGVLAMILSVCSPGDIIVAPRTAHSSFYHALILSGAVPRYLPVPQAAGIHLNVDDKAVRAALSVNPDAKAVFLTSPSYHGVCANVSAIAGITAEYNIPLLVDEAHGAHLGFFAGLPPAAGALADLRVQSWHKTLGALTPGAVLHKTGPRINTFRLEDTLQWVQTSSPSYPLLLSLDAVRKQMALSGEELARRMFEHALELRSRLKEAVPLLGEEQVNAQGFSLDITKVTVLAAQGGFNGLKACQELNKNGIDVELAQPDHLLALVGPGYQRIHTAKIADVFCSIAADRAESAKLPLLPQPDVVLPPRDAYYSKSRSVSPGNAVGMVSATMVTSYPPGIPLLVPGERITEEIIDYLTLAHQTGAHFRGLNSDGHIRVCCGEVKE